jgi:hypothetical protein
VLVIVVMIVAFFDSTNETENGRVSPKPGYPWQSCRMPKRPPRSYQSRDVPRAPVSRRRNLPPTNVRCFAFTPFFRIVH